MDSEDLLKANIQNLTSYWTACGIESLSLPSGSPLFASLSWPWRLWFDYDFQPTRQHIEDLLRVAERAAEPVMVPQWRQSDAILEESLLQAGFELKMTQEAMVANLGVLNPHPSSSMKLRWLTEPSSAAEWAKVAGESFGYSVEAAVVARLIGSSNIHFILADVDNQAVGSGILKQTGPIAGIHTMGVLRSHRRRGYARQIMFGLLEKARELGCQYSTLQASEAAAPLYSQLGFVNQGPIRSYRKPAS